VSDNLTGHSQNMRTYSVEMVRHDQNDIGSDILVYSKQNNQVVVLSLSPIHIFDRWGCSLTHRVRNPNIATCNLVGQPTCCYQERVTLGVANGVDLGRWTIGLSVPHC